VFFLRPWHSRNPRLHKQLVAGADRLKQLESVRSSDFAARFQQIYGKPLDQADREWRAFCASFR
jgi:hypothetical protein